MILKCSRVTAPDAWEGPRKTLFFKIEWGKSGRFIGPDAMPPFEGNEGWVEVLPPMTRPKVLRQVAEGAGVRDATLEEEAVIHAWRRKR